MFSIKDLNELFNILDYQIRYWILLFVLTGILIVIPAQVQEILAINNMIRSIKPIVGLLCLLSLSIILVKGPIYFIIEFIKKYFCKRNYYKKLKNLTEEEQTIISTYINKKTKTQYLDFKNGVVCELENNEIIYKASSFRDGPYLWAYNIKPWAWEYLQNKKNQINIFGEMIDIK